MHEWWLKVTDDPLRLLLLQRILLTTTHCYEKEMRWLLRRLLNFFFFFALYMWRLKMYRIETSSLLFKRLIENYKTCTLLSLSVAFIADHICLRQRIKQFHASSSESLGETFASFHTCYIVNVRRNFQPYWAVGWYPASRGPSIFLSRKIEGPLLAG